MSDQNNATSLSNFNEQPRKIKDKGPKKIGKLGRLFRRRSEDYQNTEEKNLPLRQVNIDPRKLPHRPHENQHFITNRISTTKYNFWSFLPKALLVQFLRVSNIYFLITAILCFIPKFSPLPGYSALTPLALVLFMSMTREAYEDMKRRRTDMLTNNKKCRILREIPNDQQQNHKNLLDRLQTQYNLKSKEEKHVAIKEYFKECLWSEVKCGDIIFVEEGEHLAADVVILLSSADNGECFVQTSTLDGERALKHKQCLVPIQKTVEMVGLHNLQMQIHCEAPSKNLYEFHGYLESEQLPEQGTVALHPESKKRSITLESKQIGLRGSNIANTSWIIGAVIYTGKETKLMLNYGQSRFKQSKIEKVVNIICIYLIVIQAVLCLIMSIYSGFYTSNYAELTSNGLKRKAEYIFYTEFQSQGINSTDSSDVNYSPTLTGVLTYGSYYILLNTLIPISLIVSLEFVKLTQTPFIAHDLQMYDPESMKQAQPMSMTLHEEMASIKYIFADKTGTLTANIMQFKACSIGSVCYDEEYNDDDYEYEVDQDTLGKEEEQKLFEQDRQFASLNREEINIEGDGEMKAYEFERFKQEKGFPFTEKGNESKMNRRNSITKIIWNFTEAAAIIRNLLESKRYFLNEEINLGKSQRQGEDLILRKQNEYLNQFWLNIALCHDVIASKNNQTGQLAYQGSSPDEITLLDAAKEVGYMFLDRNSEYMQIEIFGKKKSYRLLQKIDFSSDRKKMTVIVQDEQTGLITLFCKGADLAIFERLSTQVEQHFLDATKEDLIKFSTKGFRTLCFAMRVLDEEYYQVWQARYEAAKLDQIKAGMSKTKKDYMEENQLEALQREIENELFLLGATALEDKLQDGVPEAIEDFHSAGIKVWMLTGDKLETAENIGFSSKMFNEKMYIFKLQTTEKQSTRNRLNQIDQKIQDIEKTNSTPIVGTQFILNPNAGMDYGMRSRDPNMQSNHQQDDNEARNIIRALEEFKHENRASEYTINDSWARKPALKRKVRKRLEEIVPDKQAIVERLVRENSFFYKDNEQQMQYIPNTFDMTSHQYIVRRSNIYRSSSSLKQNNQHNAVVDNEDTFGILIEGQALQYIMDSDSMKAKFLKVLSKCQAVIVCRASPSQKGLVVKMVKDNEPKSITLAIGDGANDVNMIQRAHIGIGIFGKEGYQAAGNSDYAIGQFKFLRRLLFVHGRWSGQRLSTFMIFFFNKNIVFTLPQFWFGWYNGFSGQSFFDDSYLTLYNTLVTALAICSLAVWDQDINFEDKKAKPLIDLFLPQMYKETQEKELFTTRKFLVWAIISTLQSIACYGVPILTYSDSIFKGGQTQDLWAASTNAYFCIVILHYFLIFMFTKNWTFWLVFMYAMSFSLFFPLIVFTYNSMSYALSWNNIYERIGEIAFSSIEFWLMILLVIGASTLPIMFYYRAQRLLFPTLKDLILQERIDYDQIMAEADPQKAKTTHEMFKQQQQQILLQWQMEYQNFNPISRTVEAEHNRINMQQENLSPSKSPAEGSPELLHDSPQRAALSRKGLSAYRITTNSNHQHNTSKLKYNHSQVKDLEEAKEYIESERSENFLNDSMLSGKTNVISSKIMGSYLQEMNNNREKDQRPVSVQVPNQSNKAQPSKEI